MCEVMLVDGKPHPTNTRAAAARTAKKYKKHEPLFGIEQEYTLMKDGSSATASRRPATPSPQGGYYCGVGEDEIHGRPLVEEHLDACLAAGLSISGINAEVMPGQWEFQVGPLGLLEVADQLWIARWLLYRIGEDYGIAVTIDAKPAKGDWNGAGATPTSPPRRCVRTAATSTSRPAARRSARRPTCTSPTTASASRTA
jgi:glutamine synthetase